MALSAQPNLNGDSSESDDRALDGTALGTRGLRTRRQLLDALRGVLTESNGSFASVAEISRRAGVSAATFYRYFHDLDEACLALAAELVSDTTRIAALVETDWTGEDGLANVAEFVEAFLEHWDRNRPVLRMRNLAVENGDDRFHRVRLRTLRVITRALAAKMREARQRGELHPDVVPSTGATVLVGMLERVGGFSEGYSNRAGRKPLVRTVAVIVHGAVCGAGRSATDPT